jgi:hypothetical protein
LAIALRCSIPSLPLSLGTQPHISLRVYESLDSSLATRQLDNFSRQIRTLPFKLDAVDSFAGSNGVVFLAPRPSRELLKVHWLFHKDFARYRAAASPHISREIGNLIARWQRTCRQNRSAMRSRFVEKHPFLFRGCLFRLGSSNFDR